MNIALFIASEHFGGAEKVFVELANVMADKHDVAALVIRDNKIRDRLSESVKNLYAAIESHPLQPLPFV